MKISLSSHRPIARTDELDFVVELLVDVLASGDFGGADEEAPEPEEINDGEFFLAAEASTDFETRESQANALRRLNLEGNMEAEFLVGRIWAERLDWFHAEECGFEVSSVCDARSGTWMQVLETLSRNAGRTLRKDLNLTNFVSDVVFIHEVLLHPEISDRVSVLDAAIRTMSSDNSLVLMYHEQSETRHLEDWECGALGFKKIARSNLLLKDNHFRYPFGDSHTAGREVDLLATVEHEAWILSQWEELITDHPSL
jgi:hypothetical protein